MNSLKVHSIEGKGDLKKECVWLEVLADISNLDHYVLCDTTYVDPSHISNELRHMFWFKKLDVKRGDWIKLMTTRGTNTTRPNNRNTTTHVVHWQLSRTIWNKDGDAAVLFQVNTWNTTRA